MKKVIALSFTVLLLSSCGEGLVFVINPGMPPSENPKDDLTLFASELHPYLQQATCFSCHVPNGGGKTAFAQDSVELALQDLLANNVIDFVSPGQSLLVKRMRLDRHQCGSLCDSYADQFESMIGVWAQKRQNAVEDMIVLPAQSLNLNSTNQTLIFALPAQKGELRISVLVDQARGILEFRDPIVTNSKSMELYLKGLWLYVNSEPISSATTYHVVEGVIQPGQNGLLSQLALYYTLPQSLSGATQVNISFGFEVLED